MVHVKQYIQRMFRLHLDEWIGVQRGLVGTYELDRQKFPDSTQRGTFKV